MTGHHGHGATARVAEAAAEEVAAEEVAMALRRAGIEEVGYPFHCHLR